MTIATRKGILNVCEAVIATLRATMPAAIVTANAANSAAFTTPLVAPYVLSAGKTLILHRNNGAAISGTIASGTYTAAQMVVAINAVVALAAVWTAQAVFGSTRVEVYDSTRGAAGNVKIGAGTINSILGLVEGTVYNYLPLVDIQVYSARQEALEGQIAAYPALIVRADQSFPDGSKTGEMVAYDMTMRLYDTYQLPSGGPVDVLYQSLAHTAELIIGVLAVKANSSLGGQTDGTQFHSVRLSNEIEHLGRSQRSWADFEQTITVEEDLY